MTFKKTNQNCQDSEWHSKKLIKIDKIPNDIQKNLSKCTRFLRTFKKTYQN